MRLVRLPLACLFCLRLSSPASAGNDEDIPVGAEASLTGATATAIVHDGSAGYYNPAGIAGAATSTMDLSLSVYGFRKLNLEDVLVSSDGTSSETSVIDWVLVPSAMTFIRKFADDFYASFGIFIPRSSDFIANVRLDGNMGEKWILSAQDIANEYHYALSFAWALRPWMRFGFNVMGIYAADYRATIFSGGRPGANGDAITLAELRGEINYGMMAGAGLQLDPSESWAVGVYLRSPMLTVLQALDQTLVVQSHDEGPTQSALLINDSTGSTWAAEMTFPLLVRGGLAYKMDRGWLGVDVDMAMSLDRDEEVASRDFRWNLHVGGMYELSNTIALGAGVFSDRNPERVLGVDYYGLSFGGRFTSSHALEQDGEIVFVTTLGARYAYGSGDFAGIQVPDFDAGTGFERSVGKSRNHELSLNLGSAVRF